VAVVARSDKNLLTAQPTCRPEIESIDGGNIAGSRQSKARYQWFALVTLTITFTSGLRTVLRQRRLHLEMNRMRNQIHTAPLLRFCGLAFTIALWGLSYKLSLDHRHPAPAVRDTVAKLWIGPPNASLVAVQRLKDQSHLVATPQALWTSIQRLPRHGRKATYVLPVRTSDVQSFHLPASLRSPPPPDFQTA
jgi:hypothetical protein